MALQEVTSGNQGFTRVNVGHISLVLLATLLILGMGSAYAQSARTWAAVNMPAGATHVRQIAFDRSNTWYLADRTSGVWISPDQGVTWVQTNSGLANTKGWTITYDSTHNLMFLSLLPTTPGTTFALLYKSSIPVTTWTAVTVASNMHSNTNGSYTGISVAGNGNIIWGVANGMANTCGSGYPTNSGTSWTAASCNAAPGGQWASYVNTSDNSLWIGTEQYGVFRSTDNGATYTEASLPDSTINPAGGHWGNAQGLITNNAGTMFMGGQFGVWIQSGSGPVWTWTSVINTSGAVATRTLGKDTTGNMYWGHSQIATGTYAPTVWQSVDGGNTWNPFSTGIPNDLEAWQFIVNPNDGYLYTDIQNGTGNTGSIYRLAPLSGTPGTVALVSGTSSSVSGTSSSAAQVASTCAVPNHCAFTLNANLPSGVVGTPYSGSLSATGGAPYKFSVVDGALPKGLSLDSVTGAVTGAPSTANTYSFRIQATNAQGAAAGLHMQIIISKPPISGATITISPIAASLLPGSTQQFSATVQGTSNTAVVWSATAGKLTAGGYFTAPSVSRTTAVTVTATSSADTTKKASASITVAASGSGISVAVSPSTAALTSGNSQQFTAMVQGTGNTAVTWSTTSGTVSSSGMFTAPSVTGSTNVIVTATSAANTTKKSSASVAVSPGSSALSIATPSLPSAQAGTAYSHSISAIGGSTPYQWRIASGSLPQGLTLTSSGQLGGTTNQTGLFSFTAQVTDAGNTTVSKTFPLAVIVLQIVPQAPPSAGNYDGPAELPRIYMQTALANTPAPGSTTLVPAGGSLQTALNNANCGDTIELQAGATFSGIFTLPAKACDAQHWIIVRTSAPDSSLPAEGTRMTPCYAGVASLPGRPSFNCPSPQNVLAAIVDPQFNSTGPILLASGANYYRLLGLEITRAVGTGVDYQLVSMASGTASNLILDRVWMHGTAQDETKTGIQTDGMTYAALIDSYNSDFHCTSVVGTCTDAKVVGGGTSTYPGGPFKVTNNFLEASGENILFGGGPATATPTDFEIRHNHFFKPLIWLPGQPGFVGGASGHPFMVKNLLELKNAQRVLVEGNIFEYSWGGFSQPGYMLLLAPKNQASGCPICEVTDVTIRYNTFSHAGGGFQIENVPDDNGAVGKDGERYSIHDVTVDDINRNLYAASPGSSNGNLFQVISWWPASGQIQHLTINHITGFPDPNGKVFAVSNPITYPEMTNFVVTNSIFGQTQYPVWSSQGSSSDCSVSLVPVTVFSTCFSPLTFDYNALIDTAAGHCGGGSCTSGSWPSGNFFPASPAAVGFANFNNGIGGDYTLLSTSPHKNAGSDGKDLGADINAIQNAIAGVY